MDPRSMRHGAKLLEIILPQSTLRRVCDSGRQQSAISASCAAVYRWLIQERWDLCGVCFTSKTWQWINISLSLFYMNNHHYNVQSFQHTLVLYDECNAGLTLRGSNLTIHSYWCRWKLLLATWSCKYFLLVLCLIHIRIVGLNCIQE